MLSEVTVSVLGRDWVIPALLDSGANVSLLTHAQAARMGLQVLHLATPLPLTTVGGECMVSAYIPCVRVSLGRPDENGRPYLVDFLVVKSLHVDLLLGRDAIPALAIWQHLAKAHNMAMMSLAKIQERITLAEFASIPSEILLPMDLGAEDEYMGMLPIEATWPVGNLWAAAAQGSQTPPEVERPGSPVSSLLAEFADRFSGAVGAEPARVKPFSLRFRTEELPAALFQAPRFRSEEEVEEIRKQVDAMLHAGIIRVCADPVAGWSQIHLVKKKDDTYRFCVDFRHLNEVTLDAYYPLPIISELLPKLQGFNHFAVMDLLSGYWQVPLTAEAQETATFITPDGVVYAFQRLPFGLKNAPAHFQRMMEQEVLKGLIGKSCFVYLDDVIIVGTSQEDYLANLRRVLERFREFNLTLKASKCQFNLEKVEFVGHVISENTLSISDERKSFFSQLPLPASMTQLRSFLGLSNYYRDYIHEYTELLHPLQALVDAKASKKAPVAWTSDTQKCFEEVKQTVAECSPRFLQAPEGQLHLFSDASDVGMGGVLFQEQEGKLVPLRFVSKAFSETQKRYSVTDREALAGYYAITYFRRNLLGRRFVWHTDHAALITLAESASPRVQRYRAALLEFSFEARYLPGSQNDIADYLSRSHSATPTASAVQLPAKRTARFYKFLQSVALKQGGPPKIAAAAHSPLASPQLGRGAKPPKSTIEAVHGGERGHFGRDTTIRLLRRQGWVWRGMKSDVEAFIRECPLCRLIHQRVKISGLPQTLDVPYPHFEWGLDAFEMDVDPQGYNHGLLLIDVYSRKIFTKATRSLTSEEISPILLQWLTDFWTPFQIRVDRSKSWHNGIIKPLLSGFNVQLVDTTAYGSTKGNGLTERYIKEVRDQLTVMTRELQKPWTYCLPIVTRALNSRPMAALGFASPDEFVFGKMAPKDDYAHRAEIYDKIAAHRAHFGSKLVEKAANRMADRMDDAPIPTFYPGQEILVRNHRRAKKSPGDAHLRAVPRTVVAQDVDRITVRNEKSGHTSEVPVADVLYFNAVSEDMGLEDIDESLEELSLRELEAENTFFSNPTPGEEGEAEREEVEELLEAPMDIEESIPSVPARSTRRKAKFDEIVTSTAKRVRTETYCVQAIRRVLRIFPEGPLTDIPTEDISILCSTLSGELWFPLSVPDILRVPIVRQFVNKDTNLSLREFIFADVELFSSFRDEQTI